VKNKTTESFREEREKGFTYQVKTRAEESATGEGAGVLLPADRQPPLPR